MPTIRVGHSPDSDDAFMFYALTQGKIPTGDRVYVHELADIETLNERAIKGDIEVTAISIHAYAYLVDKYALLPHGASIGNGYGPRLVGREPTPADPAAAIRGKRIAIPGLLTTAHLTLRLYQPEFDPVVTSFDQIEAAVLNADVDCGLLIHEGQLTYTEKGLELWCDMGKWWKQETGLPLPLGGNVVRRDLGETLMAAVSSDLKASIIYGLEHRSEALDYARRFAHGLNREQVDRFVSMYVNSYTVDYGDSGRRGVDLLLERAAEQGIIPSSVSPTFVTD